MPDLGRSWPQAADSRLRVVLVLRVPSKTCKRTEYLVEAMSASCVLHSTMVSVAVAVVESCGNIVGSVVPKHSYLNICS